jgi:hypothetical protein
MEIDAAASAVDGFPRMAAIFLYCKPAAAVNRKIERREGASWCQANPYIPPFNRQLVRQERRSCFSQARGSIHDFAIIRGAYVKRKARAPKLIRVAQKMLL